MLRDHEATNLHAQVWAQQQLNDLPPNVDIDFEFTTTAHPKSFSKEFQHWVTVFEKEINTVRRLNFDAVKIRRLDLLEVMCSSESELTKQVNQHHGQAQRFGLSEGDLRKPEARIRLFQMIMLRCPKHLWYSPECGPCGIS